MTMICKKCGADKTNEPIYLRKEGLCKRCYSERRKELRLLRRDIVNAQNKMLRDVNREKYRQQSRDWARNNKNKRLWRAAKDRADKCGLDFNIDVDDIVIPDVCPVLGIPIIIGDGRPHDNSPTLDKIDPSKGYIKGNVRVISFRANTIKSNGSYEEHLLISKYIKENTQVISCDYSI